ncbi:Peptide-N4-(N-acetyl-beta-glucosaminyl) asparagine amidase A protein [Prunus dulcis]|uniref:Methyltransferase n=1 Tax=Prunus dulcis TaxID=3755 RepID=A0A4Y1R1V5_PRUDU|nr:Peptide-N4-(N-acetyl-beta-glucosaminyl) asparagine amidase A protein [Prunus dulcis]
MHTSNPITAPSLQTGAVSDGATIDFVTLNWELCTGWGAVDYIPCLDNFKVIRALKTRRHMERRERHCPEQSPRCLPPLPKGYKVPVPWPKSKDMRGTELSEMGISVPSFFKERKFPFIFTLSLLLVCVSVLLFTNTNTPDPLFFYSDVHTSSSAQPIVIASPLPAHTSNPITVPPIQNGPVWDETSIPVSVNFNWRLCTGSVAVDYIPCLDNFQAIKALKSRRHMEHRERYCPQPSPRCLEPLPKGYKVPVPWPESRDMIWYDNVPHPKLVEYKKDQNWVKKSDDYLIFPGGGTQFKEGVNHYTDFIEKTLPVIEWGRHVRVVLDVGCGVASFGGYLLDRNVITMSFAPKDEHEAQIQFALERGIPATLSVIGTQRLTFPDNAYDLIHCARCRVHWDADGGKPLLELNRILRPGGFFIWSATPVYRDDDRDKRVWKCSYVPLSSCVTLPPRSSWPLPWPNRLTSKPPSLATNPEAEEMFYKDTIHWSALVSDAYANNAAINWSSVRNVMDMNAGYGGMLIVVALIQSSFSGGAFQICCGTYRSTSLVMNVVPVHVPDTLSVIFDRGLIGIYHDWCESLNTYPRTYDLLHSSFLFENLSQRCDMIDVVVEMDRILRPGGYLVVQDTMEMINKMRPILHSLHWSTAVHKDQFLFGKKGFWRPGRGSSKS